MNIPIAGILVGIWLILASQGEAGEVLTLAIGITVTVLCALVLLPLVQVRREP